MKRCSKCGVEKPLEEFHRDRRKKDGRVSRCKRCVQKYNEMNREYFHEYRIRNKEKNAEYNHEYREKNKDEMKEYQREYRIKNKDKIREYQSAYRKRNRDKAYEYQYIYQRGYYDQNRPILLEKNRRYRQTPNGKANGNRHNHKRRSQMKDTEVTLSAEQWSNILKMQNNRCNICRKRFTKHRPPTMDHIIPVSQGGGLTFENVQALHGSCNSSKSCKLDYRFIQTWASFNKK